MDPSITLDGALAGCIECGVVGINPSGQVVLMNPTASKLLGMAPSLPAGLEVLPAVLRKVIRKAQEAPNADPLQSIRVSCNGNGDRSLAVDVVSLSFQGGQQGLLLTVSGLNLGELFQSKLRHFERLTRLGVLSAGLAHELRNSMVALSTMTDLLLDKHQDHELAQTVRRELDRANQLATRMLRYSRPQAQERKPTSTHAVLERALRMAHPRLKEAGTIVTQSLRAQPDVVTADEAHLEQVFLNLLLNAADAVHPAGEVDLSTDLVEEPVVGRAVRIAVRDKGIGITPEALMQLFQPFFTTKRHGTGLGLYLAQRIIDEHSGTIHVNSTPGQGTCVLVHLPVHST